MKPHEEFIRIVPGADTAVLMIHGIVGTPRHFDFLLPAVPESVSLWNMLLPGHGGTTENFGRSGMEKWIAETEKALLSLAESHRRLIVVGHSMGTLLALRLALKYPGKVSQLFLLAVPLRMMLTPTAMATSLHTAFGNSEKDTPLQAAARRCGGTALSRDPFAYLGWIPRYLELFALARQLRPKLHRLTVPCRAYQSRRDELVSMRSCHCLRQSENIQLHILEKSMHYFYTQEDEAFLRNELKMVIEKEEVR